MKKQIYTLTNEAFVEWLKSQRESKGLTVRQVGEIIGRDFSIISKVETQVRRMDVAEFYEYCELLELDPHDCFRFIKEKKLIIGFSWVIYMCDRYTYKTISC